MFVRPDSPHILVAGGAGYIGSHTAKQLRRAGMTPVVVDNFVTGNRFAARFGPCVEGSVADASLIRCIVRDYSIQGALLFAAHAYVGESVHNPGLYYRNNVAASLCFLDALLETGVRNLVFSSSCSIYGMQKLLPISEDAPKNPLSPYAETKLFLEQILNRYDSAYGLRSACLRYFNAAGADPEGEIGESHHPETHLIPLAIYAAMGRSPLHVFGTDYPTPDGTAVRDYVHVTDLAEAHILALRHLLETGMSFQVNLGTGKGHSIREVVRMVETVSGRCVPVQYDPRRSGDAPVLVADPSRARTLLGWTARHSSLETIVSTAWHWHTVGEPGIREPQGVTGPPEPPH